MGGKEYKEYVEKRLATLEESGMRGMSKGISKAKPQKFEKKPERKGTETYNEEADAVEEPVKKKKRKSTEAEEEAPKKKKKQVVEERRSKRLLSKFLLCYCPL